MSEHVHIPTNPGQRYEYCECGAVRFAPSRDCPAPEWHVCDLCRMPS